MVNLIQPITVQQAHDGITHERWRASWNWWWRMGGDDDGVDFPSPEPKTDSKSALPRKNRRWRRLHIVKCDELFSLIFSPRIGIYRSGNEVGGATGGPQATGARPRGVGAPPWLVARWWAPCSWFFRQYFLLIPKIFSINFQVNPRTFISAQK